MNAEDVASKLHLHIMGPFCLLTVLNHMDRANLGESACRSTTVQVLFIIGSPFYHMSVDRMGLGFSFLSAGGHDFLVASTISLSASTFCTESSSGGA